MSMIKNESILIEKIIYNHVLLSKSTQMAHM